MNSYPPDINPYQLINPSPLFLPSISLMAKNPPKIALDIFSTKSKTSH